MANGITGQSERLLSQIEPRIQPRVDTAGLDALESIAQAVVGGTALGVQAAKQKEFEFGLTAERLQGARQMGLDDKLVAGIQKNLSILSDPGADRGKREQARKELRIQRPKFNKLFPGTSDMRRQMTAAESKKFRDLQAEQIKAQTAATMAGIEEREDVGKIRERETRVRERLADSEIFLNQARAQQLSAKMLSDLSKGGGMSPGDQKKLQDMAIDKRENIKKSFASKLDETKGTGMYLRPERTQLDTLVDLLTTDALLVGKKGERFAAALNLFLTDIAEKAKNKGELKQLKGFTESVQDVYARPLDQAKKRADVNSDGISDDPHYETLVKMGTVIGLMKYADSASGAEEQIKVLARRQADDLIARAGISIDDFSGASPKLLAQLKDPNIDKQTKEDILRHHRAEQEKAYNIVREMMPNLVLKYWHEAAASNDGPETLRANFFNSLAKDIQIKRGFLGTPKMGVRWNNVADFSKSARKSLFDRKGLLVNAPHNVGPQGMIGLIEDGDFTDRRMLWLINVAMLDGALEFEDVTGVIRDLKGMPSINKKGESVIITPMGFSVPYSQVKDKLTSYVAQNEKIRKIAGIEK